MPLYKVYDSDAFDNVIETTKRVFGTDWIQFDNILEGLNGHEEISGLIARYIPPAIETFSGLQNQLANEYPRG